MTNTVIDAIISRRSIRSYTADPLSDEEIKTILEAGKFAPSGHNCQPWHFTVIRNKEIIDTLSKKTKELLSVRSEKWMAELGKSKAFHLFYNAPAVVVVSAHKDALTPDEDCAAAVENMLIAAESLDIGTCWVGLIHLYFGANTNGGLLNLPEGYKPYDCFCAGHKNTHQPARPPHRDAPVKFLD